MKQFVKYNKKKKFKMNGKNKNNVRSEIHQARKLCQKLTFHIITKKEQLDLGYVYGSLWNYFS